MVCVGGDDLSVRRHSTIAGWGVWGGATGWRGRATGWRGRQSNTSIEAERAAVGAGGRWWGVLVVVAMVVGGGGGGRGQARHTDAPVTYAEVVVQRVPCLVYIAAHRAGEGVLHGGVLVCHVYLEVRTRAQLFVAHVALPSRGNAPCKGNRGFTINRHLYQQWLLTRHHPSPPVINTHHSSPPVTTRHHPSPPLTLKQRTAKQRNK